MAETVQLTDLHVIQRFSLAVRGATADRAEVLAALRADVAWLQSVERHAPSRPVAAVADLPLANEAADPNDDEDATDGADWVADGADWDADWDADDADGDEESAEVAGEPVARRAPPRKAPARRVPARVVPARAVPAKTGSVTKASAKKKPAAQPATQPRATRTRKA